MGLSLLFFTGCEKKEDTNTEPTTKCGAGKCDSAMQKSDAPAQKCNTGAKDGDH